MRLITAERLTISHGGDPVLRDVYLSREPGEIVTLVGPNGSGRSTLVRALLVNPELLILDEAAQGLDQPGVASLYRLIGEVRQGPGCAALMVSHDLHVVMSGSDRVICLNGHVCCEGTPQGVSAAPEYRALFGPGTGGALALYRHDHDHGHDHDHDLTTGAEARR